MFVSTFDCWVCIKDQRSHWGQTASLWNLGLGWSMRFSAIRDWRNGGIAWTYKKSTNVKIHNKRIKAQKKKKHVCLQYFLTRPGSWPSWPSRKVVAVFFFNLKVLNRLLLTFHKFLGFAEVNKPWSTRSLRDFLVYPVKTELCKGDHRHVVYSIRLRTFAELSPPFLLANQEGPNRYSTPRAKCQIPIWNNLW